MKNFIAVFWRARDLSIKWTFNESQRPSTQNWKKVSLGVFKKKLRFLEVNKNMKQFTSYQIWVDVSCIAKFSQIQQLLTVLIETDHVITLIQLYLIPHVTVSQIQELKRRRCVE